MLGISCGTLIHHLVIPQCAGDALRKALDATLPVMAPTAPYGRPDSSIAAAARAMASASAAWLPGTACRFSPGSSKSYVRYRVLGYVVGLALAILLTATSFFVAGTDLVWQPSIPVAIVVLAIAQMGCIWYSSCTSPPGPTTPTM
jgi:hypothetical protein